MSYKSEALGLLEQSNVGMTVLDLTSRIKGSCGSTIARALRKLRSEGYVDRYLIGPKGIMRWHVHPNAVLPYQSPSQRTKNITKTKATQMCLPLNKPTFTAAVIEVVNSLMSAKQNFSAYDVTTKLRQMVSDASIHVDDAETGTVNVHGRNIAKIAHEDTRDVVHSLFRDGKLDGYTRVPSNDHWTYEPKANPQPPTIVMLVPTSNDYNGDPVI